MMVLRISKKQDRTCDLDNENACSNRMNKPCMQYRGADKSLARPDWKKQLKGRHFSSDTEVTVAVVTWLDGQPSAFFVSGLQKLEFGHCSLFPSWLG